MDRFDAMAALLEVVRAGSFSAAARGMGIPATSLTRRITDLEARLGAKLLNRSTRSLTLTDAGAVYVRAARRIIEEIEEAERVVAGEYVEPQGELVLTAPAMFGRVHVMPVVTEFLAAFPRIDLRLLLTDAVVPLIEERIDLAVRLGDLPDSSLVAARVGQMRTVLCASPAVLAAHGAPSGPADLATLPTIAVGATHQRHVWRFAGGAAVVIAPRLTVTTTDAAVEAAVLGAGFTQQRFYQVADRIAEGSLRLCLPEAEPLPTAVHVLHLGRDHLPLKSRRFLDFALPRLRQRLSTLARHG